ncbi:MAG: protein kinase domain-containing protein [Verrucomicrobiales bacterium]
MSERYQIKAKIGQGGIGAVYRAFDTHLQREVAVKRLLPPEESEAFDEDPTKSLFKEAHLLSALQHPNVVSVYDVGTDSDGVFVVMELVDGETFDQVVDRGLLTEDDFAEMVSQTLEALIAAQDKALVHRDIKPTNLMVKWLPSGKFQFKLLDFGLAKFSPKPSQQTIGLNDAILGSIHFMAPEQFERLPLDGRTDLYAMGCMYYYGLTGRYPFDGDTAAEVMSAHLSHRLTPMLDIRPDLTKRTCDWIMWLMNRDVNQRPVNAQEALEVFFNADFVIPGSQSAPRLIIPGATPVASPRLSAPPAATASPVSSPMAGSGPVRPGSGPVRAGSGAVRLGSAPVRPVSSQVPVVQGPTAGPIEVAQPQVLHSHYQRPQAKSPVLKWTIISIISGVLIIGGTVAKLSSGSGAKKEQKRVIEYVNDESNTSGSAEMVNLITPYLLPPAEMPANDRENLERRVKSKLEQMGGEGVEDAILVQLGKTKGSIQRKLMGVIAMRGMKDAIPELTNIAITADDENAKTAVQAMSNFADETHAENFMRIMIETKGSGTRMTAKQVMEVLMERAKSKEKLVPAIEKGLASDVSKETQQSSLALLGLTGSPAAAKAIDRVLTTGDVDLKIAAVLALRDWPDDSQLDRLASLATSGNSDAIKTVAFEAFVRALAMNSDRKRTDAQQRAWWGQAEILADTRDKKRVMLNGIAIVPKPFALEVASKFQADPDANIRTMATAAGAQIQQSIAAAGKKTP